MRPAPFLVILLLAAFATPAAAQAPDGAAVFEANCASCHVNPAPDSRAPTRDVLAQIAPESIMVALTRGLMFRQGTGNAYAEPNSKASDAVVAFDMASGKILWTFQPTQDVWVGGCKRGDEN